MTPRAAGRTPRAALARGLAELSLQLPPDAPEKLIAYLDLLVITKQHGANLIFFKVQRQP